MWFEPHEPARRTAANQVSPGLAHDVKDRSERWLPPVMCLPMNARFGSAALLGLVVVAACSRPTGPMLHERQQFEGGIDLELSERGHHQHVQGTLAYDRTSGHVQLREDRDGAAVALVRLPSGDVRAFVDGAPQPMAAEDEWLFEALLRAIDDAPPARARIETLADGYRIVDGTRTLTIRATPALGPHGG